VLGAAESWDEVTRVAEAGSDPPIGQGFSNSAQIRRIRAFLRSTGGMMSRRHLAL